MTTSLSSFIEEEAELLFFLLSLTVFALLSRFVYSTRSLPLISLRILHSLRSLLFSMKNRIFDSIQKNADLASIASVGAAVGIETLPVGHSWTELAQSVISLKNYYFTDLSTLTYVHALLLEGGYDYNPIMIKTLEIIRMWGTI